MFLYGGEYSTKNKGGFQHFSWDIVSELYQLEAQLAEDEFFRLDGRFHIVFGTHWDFEENPDKVLLYLLGVAKENNLENYRSEIRKLTKMRETMRKDNMHNEILLNKMIMQVEDNLS